jgi:hypothetical protein
VNQLNNKYYRQLLRTDWRQVDNAAASLTTTDSPRWQWVLPDGSGFTLNTDMGLLRDIQVTECILYSQVIEYIPYSQVTEHILVHPTTVFGPQSNQSAGPVRFLIFCLISIFLLASLVAGRRHQCNAGAVQQGMYSTIPIHWNIKSAPASPGRSHVGPAFYVFSFLGLANKKYRSMQN